MVRERAVEWKVGRDRLFRWRGGEVSRIEGFSDAVFAFAMTLLVVSLEVPVTFGELAEKMLGFIPFGITFLMFMQVWYWHYKYFRRYGLQDTPTIILNAVLLFVVLMYVFPLKFLFTLLVNQFRGVADTVMVNGKPETAIEGGQWNSLMIIYGVGYIAVHGLFALLYWHAYRQRQALELNSLEVCYTTNSMWLFLWIASVGVASVIIAAIGGPGSATWAGLTYMLIGPVITAYTTIAGRRVRDLEAKYNFSSEY